MIYREALDLIFNHADASASPQRFWVAHLANSEQLDFQLLQDASLELVTALDTINRSVNGRKPLETEDDIPLQVDRELTGAIAEILERTISMLYRGRAVAMVPGKLENSLLIVWRVSQAWVALLQGEFSDLSSLVAERELTLAENKSP